MTCCKCNEDLVGVRFHKIEAEKNVFYCCVDCLKRARNRLKRMKYKTLEEDTLLKQLERVLVVN